MEPDELLDDVDYAESTPVKIFSKDDPLLAAKAQFGSYREEVAEGRIKTRAERRTTLDLPAHGSLQLVAEYCALPYESLRAIGRKNEKKAKNGYTWEQVEVMTQADQLAACCTQIFMRHDGELLALGDVLAGKVDEPCVKYDVQLADVISPVFGKIDSARNAVLRCFQNDTILLATHHQELLEWMTESDEEASEDFLGE